MSDAVFEKLAALTPDRRSFLKALGGGLTFLLTFEADAQESGANGHHGRGHSLPENISAWLHIGEDSTITVFTGKVEVGQNARTALTQAVSEELRTPPQAIRLVMGDTDRTPFDMGTFGSRTTPTMAPQLRRAAVAAREALLDLAAQRWKSDASSLEAGNGCVRNRATGKTLSFGELTKGQNLVQTIGAVKVDKPLSRSLAKVDGRDFVTGKHQFTADLNRPGMLYGGILRPSAFHATISSLDTSAAEKLPGVRVVREGELVGVTAPNTLAVTHALAAIKATWKTEPQPSNKNLFEYLKANPDGDAAGEVVRTSGSAGTGLEAAGHRLNAVYHISYIAHVPLEPRAAVAEWNGRKLTVWTGTQRPFGVRSELAQAFHLPEESVRVLVPDTGSAYGGKHSGECAVEAATLAKAVGRPVKLMWTREEEFTWAYFRPAGVIEIRSAAGKDGKLAAWEFHNYNSGASGITMPYDVPNQQIVYHPARSPLRQGSYRGLASTANNFARESHMDDLARTAGFDPLAFRLKNLSNERLRAVLSAATERFGWGRTKIGANRGAGLACGTEKGGYVATCAEISIDPQSRNVKVERLVTAFECGAIVNPDQLKNQVEGAGLMGLGGALFEAIQFANGRILNPKLSEYRVPRFSDLPALETILLNRRDLDSSGAGETPIMAIAPAIGNAIYDALQIRVRALPMAPHIVRG
jgi:isoquinoline 1-oxidoreductase